MSFKDAVVAIISSTIKEPFASSLCNEFEDKNPSEIKTIIKNKINSCIFPIDKDLPKDAVDILAYVNIEDNEQYLIALQDDIAPFLNRELLKNLA